jgi:hypothetical protein
MMTPLVPQARLTSKDQNSFNNGFAERLPSAGCGRQGAAAILSADAVYDCVGRFGHGALHQLSNQGRLPKL